MLSSVLGQMFAQAPGGMSDMIDKLARTPQSRIVEFVAFLTLARVIMHPFLVKTPPYRRVGFFPIAQFLNEFLDAVIYAAIFVFLLIRPFAIQAFKIPSGSMVSTLDVNDFIVANKLVYRYSNPHDGDIVVFRPPADAVTKDEMLNGQVNVDFIKRCIGQPGDTIEIRNRVLYRNGKAIQEPYVHNTQCTDELAITGQEANCETFRELTPAELQAMPNTDFKLVKYDGQYWPLTIEGQIVNGDPFLTAAKYQVRDSKLMRILLSLPPAPIPKGYYLMMGDNRNNSYDGRAWGLVPRANIVGKAVLTWFPLSRIHLLASDPGVPEATPAP